MKVDGGCHCGSITFEAEIDPDAVGICHCTDCQRLSGTASGGGPDARGQVHPGSGAPRALRERHAPGRRLVRTPEDKFTLVSGAPRALSAPPTNVTLPFSARSGGAVHEAVQG